MIIAQCVCRNTRNEDVCETETGCGLHLPVAQELEVLELQEGEVLDLEENHHLVHPHPFS